LILAALSTLLIVRGIQHNVDDSPVPTQRSNNMTDTGTTGETGAPTQDTNTPADRTVPDPSGGRANTLLQP
jgi:hypothetical protein